MRAVLLHAWLLLTLRHDGQGLARSWSLLFALMALASLIAALRWEVLYEPYWFSRLVELTAVGLALFFWLLLLALISPRFCCAYALVSGAADCMTIVLGLAGQFGPSVQLWMLLIQVVALARIATVLLRRARADERRGRS